MNNLIKSLIATTVASCSFAATSAPPAVKTTDPNPLARWGTKQSSNLYVTGEAVWFRPLNYSRSAEYKKFGLNNVELNKELTARPNEFQPGFRVGLGYNTNYDGWDINLTYTRFEYALSFNYGSAYTASNNFSYLASLSRPKLTFDYNLGDLDLGRMYKVGQYFKLRPHVGIRGLWLTQKENFGQVLTSQGGRSTGILEEYDRFTFKNTLVGIETGVDITWMLSDQFSIYSNLGVSSLVNYCKPTTTWFEEAYTSPDQQLVNFKYNFSTRITNNFDLALGVRWDKTLSEGRYHLGLNVGYEHHTYWDMTYTNNGYDIGLDDTFNLQGLAVGARFDF